ncbi:hypothetical protein TOPH_08421 [Tolypocladium ophioglossoides CBS 100239]|uniref:MFS transporter n=1 Tax=Tolypocladium ophioglossoides (strain CBS 100239) TaxID=1163406 RepID=A0A0L0MYR2_TOLOC|nr:hypothetical protein TOPH_08421 [Tolypocladium ophioglossoides CBS 100239]
MVRIHLLALLLAALIALASAASAPTFCKCTCFKNSTILPLGPAGQNDGSSSSSLLQRSLSFNPPLQPRLPVDHHPDTASTNGRRSASTSCSECTKAFCLSQGIDFCKDAKEENVVTMCFQRDSNKDKIIVWGFILGTVGLLGWAAFKHVVEWRDSRAMSRQDINYAAVAGGQ